MMDHMLHIRPAVIARVNHHVAVIMGGCSLMCILLGKRLQDIRREVDYLGVDSKAESRLRVRDASSLGLRWVGWVRWIGWVGWVGWVCWLGRVCWSCSWIGP